MSTNKCDLYEERQISNEEGEEFDKSLDTIFATTLAKNDSGITSLFENIAKKLIIPDFDSFIIEEKKEEE